MVCLNLLYRYQPGSSRISRHRYLSPALTVSPCRPSVSTPLRPAASAPATPVPESAAPNSSPRSNPQPHGSGSSIVRYATFISLAFQNTKSGFHSKVGGIVHIGIRLLHAHATTAAPHMPTQIADNLTTDPALPRAFPLQNNLCPSSQCSARGMKDFAKVATKQFWYKPALRGPINTMGYVP